MVNYVLEVFAKVLCIGLLLFQGMMLNAYLVLLHDRVWWSWLIADMVVIIAWIFSLIIAKRKFDRKKDGVDGRDSEKEPDEIKYTFYSWLVYAVLLCPRVVILFHKNASTLEEDNVLGPNYLKVAVSCTPLIFVSLICGHHSAKPHTPRRYLHPVNYGRRNS